VYTQAAMISAGEQHWAICGVTQRSRHVLDALEPQDGLYSVLSRGRDTSVEVMAPLRELLFARTQATQLLDRIATASTHVVTLTVTEKAYRHDPISGRLNVDDPEIRADAAGRPPLTVVGQLVRGLQLRQQRGGEPVTVVCCDNLTHNGAILRQLVDDFAAMLPTVERAPLTTWIADSVRFPSTMVDRIVPATTEADRRDAAELLQFDDMGAVVAEPFSQWVIEDDFGTPRPAWERAGAILTADVAPYETMKLRLVNGSHSALAYLGVLAGYEHVAQFMAVEGVATYLRTMMDDEAAPTLRLPEGFDLAAYIGQLMERFANPGLRHRVAQIAMDGSQKLPSRLLATVRDRLLAGGSQPRLSMLAVAAWMRYVSARVDDGGRPVDVDDPLGALFAARLVGASTPAAIVDRLVGVRAIFGDLGEDPQFRQRLTLSLADLTKSGALACLRAAVA
jgi:fructuronate reductase